MQNESQLPVDRDLDGTAGPRAHAQEPPEPKGILFLATFLVCRCRLLMRIQDDTGDTDQYQKRSDSLMHIQRGYRRMKQSKLVNEKSGANLTQHGKYHGLHRAEFWK